MLHHGAQPLTTIERVCGALSDHHQIMLASDTRPLECGGLTAQEPQHKVEQRMLELEEARKKMAEVSQEAAQKLLEVQQDKHQTLRTGCVASHARTHTHITHHTSHAHAHAHAHAHTHTHAHTHAHTHTHTSHITHHTLNDDYRRQQQRQQVHWAVRGHDEPHQGAR
jgi:hypothetical protein